jgi:hypothetical protein
MRQDATTNTKSEIRTKHTHSLGGEGRRSFSSVPHPHVRAYHNQEIPQQNGPLPQANMVQVQNGPLPKVAWTTLERT